MIAPQGELVEQVSGDPVRRAFGEASGGPAPETLLRDVTDAIAAAKTDSRIKLIVLDLDEMEPSGLSKLQEIMAALRDLELPASADCRGRLSQPNAILFAAQAGEVYLDPIQAP